MTRRKRVQVLEAARRQWEAEHVPVSEVCGFLSAVLTVVQQEAGQATFQRVAGRMVAQKTARVASLSGVRA